MTSYQPFSNDALIIGRPDNFRYTMVGWRKLCKGWWKGNVDGMVTTEECRVVNIQHIYKEGNSIAGLFAKKGIVHKKRSIRVPRVSF